MSQELRVLLRELASVSAGRRDRSAQHRTSGGASSEFESTDTDSSPADPISQPAEQPRTGDPGAGRCGPYRLIRLLGNGGMGAVYLAERVDGELEQRVAIKLIRPNSGRPSLHGRFLRERQILASLNHPRIAGLLDAGHSSGRPYLVMEFVEGTSIDRYCAGLPAREILELFIKVADAVSHAHRNLIVHRDLKPSNILVDEAGQPKLLDFGIAKLLDAPDDTHTVDRAMTPEYASPEQLRGAPQATTTDIFSLGAVLYRLLTGNSPREFSPSTRELPKDLAAIIAKAMREEPNDRYGSADLLIADIQAYLERKPVRARRGNAVYRARKFLRRHWLPMAAGVVTVLSLAAGSVVANRERAVADRRFQQVRALSREFLDLDADIRSLPGSTKARNRLVTASLEYLERLAAEPHSTRWGIFARPDLDFTHEMAVAYLRVARVQGVPISANLGQFQQAKYSLTRADALVETVLAEPRYANRRRALLTSAEIARDAMILADTEKHFPEATAFNAKSARRLEELLSAPGYSNDEAIAAAGLYVNLAQFHNNRHHPAEASEFGRKAVELTRRTGREDRQLGKALGILANGARFSGDLDSAFEAIRDSCAIAERLARPDNAESMLTLSAAYWRQGLILGEPHAISLDRPRDAEASLTKALDVAESLARKDPHDYTSRIYVSMSGRSLAEILSADRPARALAMYEATARRLGEIKNNSKARRDEVSVLAGSAYPLRRLGHPAEALHRIESALDKIRALDGAPPRIEPGGEYETVLRALADHYADTGRLADAIRTYEELQAKLMASGPRPEYDLRHAQALSRLYGDLGNLEFRVGHVAPAKALFQRRLDLWRHWDRKLPANSFVRRQLADAEQVPVS